MVLFDLAPNPYDAPTAVQELHSSTDDRVMALRPKLQPPEVRIPKIPFALSPSKLGPFAQACV